MIMFKWLKLLIAGKPKRWEDIPEDQRSAAMKANRNESRDGLLNPDAVGFEINSQPRGTLMGEGVSDRLRESNRMGDRERG